MIDFAMEIHKGIDTFGLYGWLVWAAICVAYANGRRVHSIRKQYWSTPIRTLGERVAKIRKNAGQQEAAAAMKTAIASEPQGKLSLCQEPGQLSTVATAGPIRSRGR